MPSYINKTDPAAWTDQEWVDHCNRVIAGVMQGRDVFVNGKRVARDDLGTYRDELKFREQRLSAATSKTSGRPCRAPVYLRF